MSVTQDSQILDIVNSPEVTECDHRVCFVTFALVYKLLAKILLPRN